MTKTILHFVFGAALINAALHAGASFIALLLGVFGATLMVSGVSGILNALARFKTPATSSRRQTQDGPPPPSA